MTGTFHLPSCDPNLTTPIAGLHSGYGDSSPIRSFSGNPFAQYYMMAIQILCYYDYLLTLPDEVLATPYRCCNFSPLYQIVYAWMGRKTWSESIGLNRVAYADLNSLLDLHPRELICFRPEILLTSSQNRYTPILYQSWLFGSRCPIAFTSLRLTVRSPSRILSTNPPSEPASS